MTTNAKHPFFKLASTAFVEGASIPAKYTCDGARDLSPPLSISGTPTEAVSLALIMDDPDVPRALKPDGVFDHWILFNMPADTKEIAEGGSLGTPGANGAGHNAYTGPCPPRFSRSEATMKIQVGSQGEPPPKEYEPSEHRYIFTLYALDIKLTLEVGATKAAVLKALQGHIIAQTQLIGRYKRP